MKEHDELGLPLCQAAYAGTQCQGHDGHYGGEDWPHFATLTDGAVTWTDDGNAKQDTVENFINGRCCK